MRTPFLLLLAVTAASPALAAGSQPRDRDQPHHGRQNRDDDGDRSDRGGRPGGARPMPSPQQPSPRHDADPHGGDRHDGNRPDAPGTSRPGNGGIVPPGARPDRGPGGGWAGRADRGRGAPQHAWNNDRPDRGPDGWQGRTDRPREPDDRDRPRPGAWDGHRSPPPGGGWNRGRPDRGWDRGWRNDRRYDWQRFRSYNRERFRVGLYYAPGGYSYRPWYAGTRVSPYFFDRRYWIDDPAYYDLPYPPPGCAWVRYFNDVALIELDDGAVLDVLPNFFF